MSKTLNMFLFRFFLFYLCKMLSNKKKQKQLYLEDDCINLRLHEYQV